MNLESLFYLHILAAIHPSFQTFTFVDGMYDQNEIAEMKFNNSYPQLNLL
jgi:hypothetical protein